MTIDSNELMPSFEDLLKRSERAIEENRDERAGLVEEFETFAIEASATRLRLGEFLAGLARQAAQELRQG